MKYKYTNERLLEIVKVSLSLTDVMRRLGIVVAGGTHAHLKKRIVRIGGDMSHFHGKVWNHKPVPGATEARTPDHVLVIRNPKLRPEHSVLLRRCLREIGREEICAVCGQIPFWNGKKLTLQIDHINGRKLDNTRENLRWICPNCHTQTENFGSKNIASQRRRAAALALV